MENLIEQDAPDSTAVRVALWRALHVRHDAEPHVFTDEIGLCLAAPGEDWMRRGDMDPDGTRLFRASIVARARYIEDLVLEQIVRGVRQLVILGAGLDTFVQRQPQIASQLKVFEIDRPGPQRWKQQRLVEMGHGFPEHLRFVPVDFEAGADWWEALNRAGFDPAAPAVAASTGVSMYLTREAIAATLRRMTTLAAGSTFAMTFLLPLEFAEPEERQAFQRASQGARTSGTPFLSFFTPEQMIELTHECGLAKAAIVSGNDLNRRYFSGRTDGLRNSNSEQFLIATI